MTIYRLHRPLRRNGTYVKAVDPDRQPPPAYATVPGYDEVIRDVRCGRTAPPWGTDYVLLDGEPIPDFADATAQQFAISEELRQVFEEADVKGLFFNSILVNGRRTMFILGVQGTVELHPSPPEYRLVGGAEAGLYKEGTLYITDRIAALIHHAKLDVGISIAEVSLSDLADLGLLP